MNNKFRAILFVVVSLLCLLPHEEALSQISGITFDKLTHDYGTINEDSDLRICVFKFINHQKSPIAISHVQSSCGCAVPQYTKKVVPAGESGEIRIAYNPQGRPGRFNRSIIVSFSGQKEKIHLYVKGTVTPGVERKNKAYPYVMDELQLRTTGVRLKPMRSDLQQQNIMVVNSGEKAIRLNIASTISCISATLVPDVLQPGQKGEIEILRKADKNKDQAFCIRLKKNAHRQKTAGIVSIIIEAEKCTQ